MLFGHNTNITVGGTAYHVQTEDRGEAHALLDTVVYCRGRVMHRRTNNYFDLLPLDEDRLGALKLRLDDQHRGVLEEMRAGTLHLPPLPDAPRQSSPVGGASPPAGVPALSDTLQLELLNPKTWLKGKRATLQVAVRDASGKNLSSVAVTAKVEGAATPGEFSAHSGPGGDALLDFDMPRSVAGDLTMVITAANGNARGQLRLQLKAKPRVPGAS